MKGFYLKYFPTQLFLNLSCYLFENEFFIISFISKQIFVLLYSKNFYKNSALDRNKKANSPNVVCFETIESLKLFQLFKFSISKVEGVEGFTWLKTRHFSYKFKNKVIQLYKVSD